MSDTNQRKAWIDVLKGIAIMFVVLGHNPLITACPKIFNIIFSFHIPLFFFISGYLFSPNTAGGYLCKKRFNSLIRPYLFTVGVISLTYILVKSSPSPLWYIFWTFYGNGPNLPKLVFHLWFLPNLFLVTLLTWLFFRYIRFLKLSIVLQLLMITTFLILGFLVIHIFWNIKIPSSITNFFMVDGNQFLVNGLLNNPAYPQEQIMGEKQFILKGLPWSIDIILVTAAFFNSGYFIRKNNLEFIYHKHGIALLMVALFTALHFFYNYTIDLNLR
jgi:polysaccharide biosynthesis protein PslL